MTSMKQSNVAMLFKLRWCLITNQGSLQVETLKGMYFRSKNNFDALGHKNESFHIQHGIVKGVDLLKKGSNWNICNGKQVNFQQYKWLSEGRLINKSLKPIPEDQLGRRMEDYWEPGSGWKWNLLHNFILCQSLLSMVAVLSAPNFIWSQL